jgi:serine/threonine protein phosphatase PrpC
MKDGTTMQYDVAGSISRGKRDYQEDSIEICFPYHHHPGYVVIADGMGGHEAGDVASQLAVDAFTTSLTPRLNEIDVLPDSIQRVLNDAVHAANDNIAEHVARNRALSGMGTTLVAPIVVEDQLHWISVGDSVLFIYDDNKLSQLNEDHSLAPQIDMMVATGQMDAEIARTHPDRNCLTSVLMGSEISRIDSGKAPVQLHAGNIVIAGSDGLLFLSDTEITDIVLRHRDDNSQILVGALMDAIEELNDPDQDNVSIAVIKVA